MANLVPIFPLPLVLFPTIPLPLHIFEPRYKEMIAECLEQHAVFGIIHAKQEEMAEIGCTAKILDVIKRYDDGKLDILTQGLRRFEILRVNEERSFLRAEVSYFDDEDNDAGGDARKQLLHLHKQLLALSGEQNPEIPSEDSPALAFEVAARVPLDLEFKQSLLGIRSEAERVSTLIAYYEALIPKVSRALHIRTKAGSNGHAH
ncbi:MAG TPA: LON peptidase substrate-binding domain-containing protein [Terriglobales bacterium]|nr:LON peptidase substrate-binding domain-containing protein [Terriglobales bacterium]